MAPRSADLLSPGSVLPLGRKTVGGNQHTVELVYGFEQNKPSGTFTPTINR